MSNKPVMSHDPLADLDSEVVGEVVEVPDEAKSGKAAEEPVTPEVADGPLVLEASITIADVGDYHATLEQYLQKGSDIVIDGSQVESIDGAGLQLLAAFIKEVVSKSIPLKWQAASETLQRSAAQMGILTALHMDGLDEAA